MTAPRVDSWCGGSAAPPAAREMQAISILHVIGDPTKTKAKDNIVKFRKRKEMAKVKKQSRAKGAREGGEIEGNTKSNKERKI